MGNQLTKGKLVINFLVTVCLVTIIQIQIAYRGYEGEATAFRNYGSSSYSHIAENLLKSGRFATDASPTAFRPPLYPLFLAALQLRFTAIIFAQSLLAGLTVALASLIAVVYSRKEWAALWVLLLLLGFSEIMAENITQRETVLFTFLLVTSCALFVVEERYHRGTYVIGLGICMGLLCLARPLAFVGPFFAAYWAIILYRRGLKRPMIIGRTVLFLVSFFLVLLPWAIRNQVTMGHFVLTSSTTGLNLWKGNNPVTDEIYPRLDLDELEDLLGNPPDSPGWWDEGIREYRSWSEMEADGQLQRLALHFIWDNPAHFLKMIPEKLWALWSPERFPKFTADVEWTASGVRIHHLRRFENNALFYAILYLLALVGMWRLRGTNLAHFILCWVLFLSIIHAITFGESRFRWPINVLLLPTAAVGIDYVLKPRRLITTISAIRRGGDSDR